MTETQAFQNQLKPPRSRFVAIFLGKEDEPPWARPLLWGILVAAGLLYAWGLSSNGAANDYYTAAVISGSKSWSAAFFGSLDTANFITVDKPPLALWLMVASVRIFGYSSWSLLLPQAAAGVATVAVLYATVRRPLGHGAAVIAAAVAAFTPIVVAVNRWNTPDTLLVLLLVLAAWAMTRALESGGTGWLLASMVFVGLGFNVKMLQAWMVILALGFAYLLAGRRRALVRIGQLAAGAAVVIAVSASWMVVVDSIPADQRPYIGGSKDNTVFELVTGHNGLARLASNGGPGRADGSPKPAYATGPNPPADGSESAPVSGGAIPQPNPGRAAGGGPGFSGEPGLFRLFNEKMGGQISWLLPISVLGLALGLIAAGRKTRTDQARAAFVLWGIWLAVHAGLFSLSSGIIHEYYTNAMAPAMGALIGGGTVIAWRWMQKRETARSHAATAILIAGILATGVWAVVLLSRTPDWQPWLRPVIALAMVVASVLVLIYRYSSGASRLLGRAAIAAAVVAVFLAPVAYATTPLSVTSRDPLAGPASTRMGGPGQQGPPPGQQGPPQEQQRLQPVAKQVPVRGGEPQRQAPLDQPQTDAGSPPSGASTGGDLPAGGPPSGNPQSGGPDSSADPEIVEYLLTHRSGETWIAAATGSFTSAPLIIATDGEPVMTMGGFGGNDPAPTLDELKGYVERGEVRFVVVSQRGPGAGGPGAGGPGAGGPGAGGPGLTGANNAPPTERPSIGGAQVPADAPQRAFSSNPQGPQGPQGQADRNAWVVEECELIDVGAGQAQLYDCAGAFA
ncbi:MAG: glycosyl transferase family 39 [Acidobacteria bacterium]|nr:MAG: glycosyl transferase family 39 [Acidobacteriota bacterium]